MGEGDSERRPHFPQFSYSASGREWRSLPVSQYRPPAVRPFRGKHVAILGKVSPLFSFSVFECRLGEVVFLGTIKGVLHSGIDSSWSLHKKKKYLTFSTLYTAEGNVFVIYFYPSILGCRPVKFFVFFLFLTFLHLVWKSRSREQNQKCCLTCADVSYHTDRVWVGGLVVHWNYYFSHIQCHGGAHSPIPWQRESLSTKNNKKDRTDGVSFIPISLSVLFLFILFDLFIFSQRFLLGYCLTETLNCQILHGSLRQHRAQPHSTQLPV